MAAIFRAEPDWTALPTEVPEQIRFLIRRCLEKDRRGGCPALPGDRARRFDGG
jgi:hypothetical protein